MLFPLLKWESIADGRMEVVFLCVTVFLSVVFHLVEVEGLDEGFVAVDLVGARFFVLA